MSAGNAHLRSSRGDATTGEDGLPGDVVDPGEVIDLVPGRTVDTCRVLARRGGFRFDGRHATLIAVTDPQEKCTGSHQVGLHLVADEAVLWSARAQALCLDPVGGIERDRTGHAFLSFVSGAHTASLVVLGVRDDGVEDFGSLDARFAGEAATARDLDGDAVFEIVVVRNECEPSCKTGKTHDVVHRWNGQRYVES